MVIEILQPHVGKSLIFKPISPYVFDAWPLWELLNQAFPSIPSAFPFHICCANGYENAVIFPDVTTEN